MFKRDRCSIYLIYGNKKKFKFKKIKIAVPTWSYIAPANAADYVGKLELIDSNLDTHNINFKSKALNNCDVICAVDMAGVPSHYKELKKFNKIIVSDAAESYGSSYFGKDIGSNSLITTTSFQVSKVITTGEGGMIFTNDKSLYEICKLIVNQGYGKGGYSNHDHVEKGFNFRLTGLQAALGLSQLNKLKRNLKVRKKICAIYNKELKEVVNLHKIPTKFNTSFYSYVILLKNKDQRDKLKNFLKKKGIETKLWKPIHLYKPYFKFSKKKFKNAELIYNRHLRLPVNNLMRENQAKFVCRSIKIFFLK